MPVRKIAKIAKIAKIVGAAMRDADRARKASTDPKWRKAQQQDRRGTLRKFETVEHALQDREKRARSRAAKSKAKKK